MLHESSSTSEPARCVFGDAHRTGSEVFFSPAEPIDLKALAGCDLKTPTNIPTWLRWVVEGKPGFSRYARNRQRVAAGRGAVATPLRRTVQRASRRARIVARHAAKTGNGDGDGEPPSDADVELVIAILPDGTADIYVPVGDAIVHISGPVPRTHADVAEVVDIARRGAAGDSSVRWLS